MQKLPSERFFKKGAMKNLAKFTRNICAGIPFLVFSCEFCEIFKNTFFAEQHRRLLLSIAVSIAAKELLANETVNYEIKTKAYILISVRSVSY